VIKFIAGQLELPHKAWREYPWGKRTATYHRDEIREFFSFRKGSTEDAKEIAMLLVSDILTGCGGCVVYEGFLVFNFHKIPNNGLLN